MDAICEFIKDYINGNSMEELEKKIEMELEEDFESIEKCNEYIITKLKTIDEIILISNVSNYGPLDTFVADAMIAAYVNVKIAIDTILNADETICYWNVNIKTIIKKKY